MSDLGFNKIAGAVLATSLAVVGLREFTTGYFASEPPAKAGYAIEVAEEGGAEAAVADVAPDWGTVLPTADIKAGEAVFAKCQSCHTVASGGANGTGPNLWAAVGRKPGSHAGFAYSANMLALGAKQPAWEYDHLYEFLKNPKKYVADTKMSFVGLKKPEDRIAVIAYLHAQGSSLAIPAPKPVAAPAAAPVEGEAPAAAPEAAPAKPAA